MSGTTATAYINVAICGAIAVGCYVTSSGFPLFGLLCLMSFSSEKDKEDE